jgi:hypothetical protein
VSNIETDSSFDGQLLELTIDTLWQTMQNANVTLAAINYELNFIEKYTHDNLFALRDVLNTHILAINADYNSVFSTIDMNLPLTMENIRNSILGMVKIFI